MNRDPARPEFWEGIYAGGQPPWDKGEPAPPLVRAIGAADLAPGSRVLVPGCGYGHEAVHLADLGHRVTAVDFAPAAVADLNRRRAALELDIVVVEADLFDLPAFDAVGFEAIVEHTCFCAVSPARRDEYVAVIAPLLVDHGLLLGLFFEVDGTLEDGPPFPASREDVLRHFDSVFEVGEVTQPADSFPSRQGREWLATMRRR